MHTSIPRTYLIRFADAGVMFAYDYDDRLDKFDRQHLQKHFEVLVQLLKMNPIGIWLPLQLDYAIKEFEQQVEINLFICHI